MGANPLGRPRPRRLSRPPLDAPDRTQRARVLVAAGLSLVYWGVVLSFAGHAVIFPSILLPTPEWIVAGALLAWAGGGLLSVAGPIACLYVPRESRAAGLILTSVVLEIVSLLIGFFAAGADGDNLPPALEGGLRIAGWLSGLAAIVVFLLFLRRLGRYLKRSELAYEARWLIVAGLVLAGFVVIVPVILALTAPVIFFLSGSEAGGLLLLLPLSVLVYGVLLAAMIYVLIRYLRLLTDLRHALLRDE